MNIQNQTILMEYVKAFYEFELYINQINSNLKEDFKSHHGYLINFEKIEEIKRNINYDFNKNFISDYGPSPFDKNEIKDNTIKEIEFKDPEYLLNMLFNGNKYIFINTELWALLCEKDKENAAYISYEISYSYIKFKLDHSKELIFINQKNNLITIGGYKKNPEYELYESNYNTNTKIIFTKLKEYYEFEQFFKNNLKQKNSEKYHTGYLVDVNWFNNWKKFNDYSNIKNNYLVPQKQKKNIIDRIIYIQQLNKENKISLEEPKVEKFTRKKDLISFLQKKNLVVVDSSLIQLWPSLLDEKTYYYLYDNKIIFYFGPEDLFILETQDNIISIKNENNKKYPNLMQLAKIF